MIIIDFLLEVFGNHILFSTFWYSGSRGKEEGRREGGEPREGGEREERAEGRKKGGERERGKDYCIIMSDHSQ